MNSAIAKGQWQQLKGALNVRWGHVTGNHLRVLAGRHLQMVGELHAACGRASDQVGRQIDGVHRRRRAFLSRP